MLKFSKMHGLGNDFIVIDAINQQAKLTSNQIRFLADRHIGIGCDQLLLVETPSINKVDFKYRIFNSDGSEVEQCGNGVRCLARFVRDQGLTDKDTIAVETASGVIYPSLQVNGNVRVDMGLPRFEPAAIPFITERQALTYDLPLPNGHREQINAVSMGNPHAVIVVDDIAIADVERRGTIIESHNQFPQRVNVGFMEIVSPSQIKLRVYERGVGETKACGTGACAAVVSGIARGLLQRQVQVSLAGGWLTINWPDDQSSVWMTGPATPVFDGEIAWAMITNH